MSLRFNKFVIVATKDEKTKKIAEAICEEVIINSFLTVETACTELQNQFIQHGVTAVVALDGDCEGIGIFGRFEDIDEQAERVFKIQNLARS